MAKPSSKQNPTATAAALSPEEDHSAGSGSYQVVARRYRPKTFEELIGQNHIAQALANALTSGRVGHAYLFTGARGVGKTSTARIFAKSLNCVQGPTLTPCGVCDSCRSISTGEDIDVLEIDGASNRGIDEIRLLRQNASVCPSRSRFKIYIIDEVHMLTREAFNALLKTLEEPPEHVKFIFCTTEPARLPITILSRCQRFDFAGIDTTAIAGRLATIAEEEKVTAEDGVFEILARRAAGSMRDAQSLLEQLLSFAPEHITLADVHGMLGTANDQLLFRLLDALLRCDPATIFSELDTAANEGVDVGVLVEQLLQLFRDLLVAASGGASNLMLFCSPSLWGEAQKMAEQFGLHRILAAMQILDQTYTKMRYSTQGRVLTELALIRIAHLDHFQMITVLLDKLKEGTVPGPVSLPPSGPTPQNTLKSVQRAIPSPSETAPTKAAPTVASPTPQSITPQQRLAAAAPRSVGLDGMNDAKAKQLWSDVIEDVPGTLGTRAGNYTAVRFEQPDIFIIEFSQKFFKDSCEANSPQLRGLLNHAVGKAVQLRFVLVEGTVEAKAAQKFEPRVPRVRSTAEQGALLRAASENPLIKTIEDLFGAELDDIK